MNSLIHLYATIKFAKEQKRVISKRKPFHRILTGGCVLYKLPEAGNGIRPDVSVVAVKSRPERISSEQADSNFGDHFDE